MTSFLKVHPDYTAKFGYVRDLPNTEGICQASVGALGMATASDKTR